MSKIENNNERKAWVSPEFKRISAGSAEAGTGNVPDAGAPGNDRS